MECLSVCLLERLYVFVYVFMIIYVSEADPLMTFSVCMSFSTSFVCQVIISTIYYTGY